MLVIFHFHTEGFCKKGNFCGFVTKITKPKPNIFIWFESKYLNCNLKKI